MLASLETVAELVCDFEVVFFPEEDVFDKRKNPATNTIAAAERTMTINAVGSFFFFRFEVCRTRLAMALPPGAIEKKNC